MGLRPSRIHGAIARRCKTTDFVLTETVYDPLLRITRHFHTQACFYAVLEGRCIENFGKAVIESKPSSLIFRPAGEVHSDQVGNSSTRSFLIEVEGAWLDHVREYASALTAPAIFQGGALTHLAMKLRRESRQADAVTPLAVEGLMLSIIAEVGRKRIKISGRRPRWLDQTKEILHERCLEPLTLSGIAQAVGVHPVYLANVFRRYYRCSIGEYKRQLRIEFACREIAKTDAPLSQVALAAGYSDQAHFSRIFKRFAGMTPNEYRASCRH